jgi:hypothetical protein
MAASPFPGLSLIRPLALTPPACLLLRGHRLAAFPRVPLRHFQVGLISFQVADRLPAAICDRAALRSLVCLNESGNAGWAAGDVR